MTSDWTCIPKDYDVKKVILRRIQTYDHPLKSTSITMVDSKGTRGNPKDSNSSSRTSSSISLLAEPLGLALDGTDPLSQFVRQEQELTDPLNAFINEHAHKNVCGEETRIEKGDSFNWQSKRLGILNRFTTSEKLSICTSFLSTGGNTETIKCQTVVSDKVKYRLEQLDNFEESSLRHMMNLTQQEYIHRIEQLNQELVRSWHSNQRVKALKIAIQCSKMLADTTVLQFYPSQFVLITDILDIFGKLVFERLNTKANIGKGSSTKAYDDSLLESARETCQNWFYKIASIRELLPRLYIEIALIKCYSFLSQCKFDKTLLRLTRMIRGVGDPLVATYARCYLVRVGLNITKNVEYLRENVLDFLNIYHMNFSGSLRSELSRQRMDITNYLALYAPALDFILEALVRKGNQYTSEILDRAKELKNNGPLLIAIMNSFQTGFIAANALEFVNILANSNTEGVSKSQLFKSLGNCINNCSPIPEQRNLFFNTAFRSINTFTDPVEYISCIEPWAQFVAEYFTISDVNVMLGEIHGRVTQTKVYEKHYNQLQSILDKVVSHVDDLEQLFIQENFLPIVNLFHKDPFRIEVCKNILAAYKRKCERVAEETTSEKGISDTSVINVLMYVGKILNDSVTAVTVEDECRQISQLISPFIRRVNFGNDFEQQLSFYVDARSSFANLDPVFMTLVHEVNKLAVFTLQKVKGQHTRKTATFVKACNAFSFVTIPSIRSVQIQMDLYLLSGQVALLNNCLGQADACFEAALHLISELPRSIEVDGKLRGTENYLASYLCNMLATLVVVPDSPEQGVLYLLRLLLDTLKKFPFTLHSSEPIKVYLYALDMLYVQSLDEFPYHIVNVVSNDELYGHDPKFLMEINNLCAQVIEQILGQLKSLSAANQLRARAITSLELFVRVVRYADLTKPDTFSLAVNLWALALQEETLIDSKLIERARKTVEDIYDGVTHNDVTDQQRIQSLADLLTRIRPKTL